jgi:hypothetical protein
MPLAPVNETLYQLKNSRGDHTTVVVRAGTF